MNSGKIIIGSVEWCSFPQINIPTIKARIDSGAKTSALHAINIATFKKNNVLWASFDVHPIQDDGRTVVHCEAPVFDKRRVKSSSGNSELRYVIKTVLSIAENTWEVELTLTNRDSMGHRMLLGRQAMSGKMLVDPESSFLLGEPTQKGHNIEFLNIKDCYIKLDGKKPEVHYRGGRVLDDFDAIIPRIKPSMTFYGCALTRHFEAMGVYTLNTASSITKSRDKLFSLQMLINKGLPIPTTGFANSPLDTDELIDMVGGAPLIVKLLEGTQGKGVVLAETKKAAESLINAFKSLKANILVQEFIKEAKGEDIRCFVINGKVISSMMRTAAPGEFRANIHLGGTGSAVKITPEEKKVALLATKTLGLKVAGVDIIRGQKGPLLLEVNSSPGLEGIEGISNKDIAGKMIEGLEKDLKYTPKGGKKD